MGSMRKVRLSHYKQDRLTEHFISGSTAGTAASLCGVNRKTAAFYFLRLREIIETVSEGALRAGAQVRVEADPGLTATVRPMALRRALSNLVMNAAAHGEHVDVAVHPRSQGGVEIVVDDDGPGIPEDRYEEAFKAFGRLDDARNQNTKGVGLGLAIARDVARGHGGDITLARSPLGGLRAVVRLPG